MESDCGTTLVGQLHDHVSFLGCPQQCTGQNTVCAHYEVVVVPRRSPAVAFYVLTSGRKSRANYIYENETNHTRKACAQRHEQSSDALKCSQRYANKPIKLSTRQRWRDVSRASGIILMAGDAWHNVGRVRGIKADFRAGRSLKLCFASCVRQP